MTLRPLFPLSLCLLLACSGGDFSVGAAAPEADGGGEAEPVDADEGGAETYAPEAEPEADAVDPPETATTDSGPADSGHETMADTAPEAAPDATAADSAPTDTGAIDSGADTRADTRADSGTTDTYVAPPDTGVDAPWVKCQKCVTFGLCPSLAAEASCFQACGSATCAFDQTSGQCYCT